VSTPASVEHEGLDRVLDEHFRAEEAEDIDALLATFTEDAEHDGDGTRPLVGREAIGEFYRALFAVIGRHRFTTVRRLYGPDFAVDESDVVATAHGAPFGLDVVGGGREVRFRLLHVFDFRDGLISREHGWLDTKEVERQLAAPPS
jgi:predicted ester cyclase